MKHASAFCPAYATGIFTVGEGDAAGAGFALEAGMNTAVSEKRGRTSIMINGKKCAAPVSSSVLGKYAKLAGKIGALEITHQTAVPIGFGLGMSAAGALSLSLALNELLGMGLTRKQCVKMAHDADVECGTGLSGVDAASVGGMLARRDLQSAPVKLPFEEREIEAAFFKPIKTASVIGSPEWKGKVNKAGEAALAMLFLKRDWEGFIVSSRHFSLESGLAEWCKKEMLKNKRASMAMLGQTLFSDEPLALLRQPMKLLKAKTYEGGGRLL